MAILGLERLGIPPLDRQGRHGDWLAPQGPRLVLKLEDSLRKRGRPSGSNEIRELVRMLSRENPLWGAPHVHGELLKLGIDNGETSVSKYMIRRPSYREMDGTADA